MKMNLLKLKSKNGKEVLFVHVHKGNIIKDKRGFAPVKNHSMYMESINVDFVKRYYVLPDGVSA